MRKSSQVSLDVVVEWLECWALVTNHTVPMTEIFCRCLSVSNQIIGEVEGSRSRGWGQDFVFCAQDQLSPQHCTVHLAIKLLETFIPEVWDRNAKAVSSQ